MPGLWVEGYDMRRELLGLRGRHEGFLGPGPSFRPPELGLVKDDRLEL